VGKRGGGGGGKSQNDLQFEIEGVVQYYNRKNTESLRSSEIIHHLLLPLKFSYCY